MSHTFHFVCGSKLCDDKLCVSKLCVDKLWAGGAGGGGGGGGGIQNQKQEPHTKMWGKNVEPFFPHIFVWGSCFWFCIPPPPILVAIVARQEIRSIFVKNKAYFGKNRPYFWTGRWAAAWAKFGSTFFPRIFLCGVLVFGSVSRRRLFWLPSLSRQKNKAYFCQNKP